MQEITSKEGKLFVELKITNIQELYDLIEETKNAAENLQRLLHQVENFNPIVSIKKYVSI